MWKSEVKQLSSILEYIRIFSKKLLVIRYTVRTLRKVSYWAKYRFILPRLYPVITSSGLVRFGPIGDGGYLIPNDLEGVGCCFSPGVSSVTGFERDCADRGIKVYLADASIERLVENHPLFHFTKIFIGGRTQHDFITLEDWLQGVEASTRQDLILQMDIEGYEYEALIAVPRDVLTRFRIIVIEFHGLDALDGKKFRTLMKLTATHQCVHIHPNNCCDRTEIFNLQIPREMEFTFLRKDRVKKIGYATDFPHELDSDNVLGPRLTLPSCWYRQQ